MVISAKEKSNPIKGKIEELEKHGWNFYILTRKCLIIWIKQGEREFWGSEGPAGRPSRYWEQQRMQGSWAGSGLVFEESQGGSCDRNGVSKQESRDEWRQHATGWPSVPSSDSGLIPSELCCITHPFHEKIQMIMSGAILWNDYRKKVHRKQRDRI